MQIEGLRIAILNKVTVTIIREMRMFYIDEKCKVF